jgi:hypothetical protein
MGRFKIVIEDITIGFLTDEGEIISDNPFLRKLAASIKELTTLEVVRGDGDAFGQVVKTVKLGDPGYLGEMIEELLEAGYGIAPDIGSTKDVV